MRNRKNYPKITSQHPIFSEFLVILLHSYIYVLYMCDKFRYVRQVQGDFCYVSIKHSYIVTPL